MTPPRPRQRLTVGDVARLAGWPVKRTRRALMRMPGVLRRCGRGWHWTTLAKLREAVPELLDATPESEEGPNGTPGTAIG